MYTYEELTYEDMRDMETNCRYEILDPDKDVLCRVETQGEAETLISHLNR